MTHRTLLLTSLVLLTSAVNARAELVYTSSFGALLASIDTTTASGAGVGAYGLPAPIGDPPTQATFAVSGVFDGDGTLYTIIQTLGDTAEKSSSRLGIVNLNTGVTTPIGATIDINLVAMEIDEQGTLFATGFQESPLASTPSVGFFGDTKLYRVDKTTGATTEVGDTGVHRLMDLAFDSTGTLWGTVDNKLWTIDTNTGQSTFQLDITGVTEAIPADELAPFQNFVEIMGIYFGADDTLYAGTFTQNAGLFTIDTSSGAATLLGRTGIDFAHGGDILVPEPASLTLVWCVVVAVALRLRKRNRVG